VRVPDSDGTFESNLRQRRARRSRQSRHDTTSDERDAYTEQRSEALCNWLAKPACTSSIYECSDCPSTARDFPQALPVAGFPSAWKHGWMPCRS
jgi:hypothetical protein